MASTLTWLDHSDKERRRVLEALDRFKETDARDELGLGSIRDGFANLLFPGTNVLMTRARYFLFVPWLYRELLGKRSQADFERRLRDAEVRLIHALGDDLGVIGRVAKGTLKRTASSIYWLGLGSWRIRSGAYREISQAEYHAQVAGEGERSPSLPRDDDDNPLDGGAGGAWHGHLPKAPAGFPEGATLTLQRREAEYLRERIQTSAPDSLLARMTEPGFVPDPAPELAWMLPRLGELSPALKRALHHAQCFSEVMEGAALLYNLMLAEKSKRPSADEYQSELGAWSERLSERAGVLAAWDLRELWALLESVAAVRESTRAFVSQWVALRTWTSPARAREDATARRLVATRERELKGPARARLVSPRALELWSGASGLRPMSFRWPVAVQLTGEIVEALRA